MTAPGIEATLTARCEDIPAHTGRRLWLMMLALLGVLSAVPAVNLLADPYGAWGGTLLGHAYLRDEAKQARVFTPYRLRTARPTTLLLGSSRMLQGIPIASAAETGIYNAGLPGITLDETDAIVRLALKNPILKQVIWDVDFSVFNENWKGFLDADTRRRLDGDPRLLWQETLLSMEALDRSRQLAAAAMKGRTQLPAGELRPALWDEAFIREGLQQAAPKTLADDQQAALVTHVAQWTNIYGHYQLSATQLRLFADLVARIDGAGVKLILFIPPFSEFELETIRQTGRWPVFQQWKRELAAVRPYWDFSGYTQLARMDQLFEPVYFCHFQPPVGHVLLRHILGERCDQCGDTARVILNAGVWVDATSVEQHLQNQQALLTHTQEDSRYVSLAAAAAMIPR